MYVSALELLSADRRREALERSRRPERPNQQVLQFQESGVAARRALDGPRAPVEEVVRRLPAGRAVPAPDESVTLDGQARRSLYLRGSAAGQEGFLVEEDGLREEREREEEGVCRQEQRPGEPVRVGDCQTGETRHESLAADRWRHAAQKTRRRCLPRTSSRTTTRNGSIASR